MSLFLFCQGKADSRIALIHAKVEGGFDFRGFLKNGPLFSVGYCSALGFAAAYMTSDRFQPGILPVVGIALIATGVVFALYLFMRRRVLMTVVHNYFAPIIGLLLLALVVALDLRVQHAVLVVSLVLFLWQDIVYSSIATRNSRYFKHNYVRLYGLSRFISVLSMAFGWLVASYALFLSPDPGFAMLCGGMVVFVVASLAVSAAFFDKDRLTMTLSYALGIEDYGRARDRLPVQRFFDEDDSCARGGGLIEELQSVPVGEAIVVSEVSATEQAIVDLAREYNLSARETEVFAYLARGRNTKIVAQKLFISEATVRSHTYNIYGKMDVHSRQELMNVVEDYEKEIASKQ